ncbi:IclR family transcriptional regulator [Acinetobacter chengduensis]|uniref:IclR family transcriptional regulator n=1 Tax=Acinetobacter chengduensis TaxID=2420890 RepID=A0ABX9TVP6_9GAMM|nr:IclR family transcriptional regulator C-terminal domain-containing protein [Acinetobacter chengduensis]RLL21812.1 IclR family transcriptional regulator [Acinetobacter chengduensis]
MNTKKKIDSAENTLLIKKIAILLNHLNNNGKGARLKNLVLETGMAHSTVHRILNELREVDFVTQTSDKSYHLGPQLFTLGLSAPVPIYDLGALREYANELAQICNDLVYVAIKQLNGVRYILVCKGNSPILPNVLQQNDFVAFTSSYSGIVLLAYLDEDKRRNWIHNPDYSQAPTEWVSENRIKLQHQIPNLLKQVQEHGYLYGQDLVLPGVSGISTIIPSKNSLVPYMTVSISAISERLAPDRAKELIPELLKTAKKMSHCIY